MVAGKAVTEIDEGKAIGSADKGGGKNKNIFIVLFLAQEPKRRGKQQRSHGKRRGKQEPKPVVKQTEGPAGIAVINGSESKNEYKPDGNRIAGNKTLFVIHNGMYKLFVFFVRVKARSFKRLDRGKNENKLEHIEPAGVIGIVKEDKHRVKRRNKRADGAGNYHFLKPVVLYTAHPGNGAGHSEKRKPARH